MPPTGEVNSPLPHHTVAPPKRRVDFIAGGDHLCRPTVAFVGGGHGQDGIKNVSGE